MSNYLLISDAAKEVNVESHVLRYWEEELHLPIRRNELGHRYYSAEDVERFKQIKSMKERGLQLKAIKMILKNGRLDVISQEDTLPEDGAQENDAREELLQTVQRGPEMAISIVDSRDAEESLSENREEKSKRLQWILQQLISEAIQENNQEIIREIRESVLKELDYQFRLQEEREEERAKQNAERTESYYQKMDELLRRKSRGKKKLFFNRVAQEDL